MESPIQFDNIFAWMVHGHQLQGSMELFEYIYLCIVSKRENRRKEVMTSMRNVSLTSAKSFVIQNIFPKNLILKY